MTNFDFWNDFGNSFGLPIKSVFHGFQRIGRFGERVVDISDRVATSSGQIITATGDLAGGIGSIISGKSHFFVYVGIAVLAVVVLPKIVDKVL